MAGVQRELLQRRWVHAHEEDTDEEMVFRPAEYPLGPSRGRVAFELHADGSFSESGLGAADVPEQGGGTWRLERETIVLSEAATGGVPREMAIASVDEDRLVVKR
jgi:hypothetical protein